MYSALTYFGNCTLEVVSYLTEDNGKTITVIGGGRTFTDVLSDGKVIFKGLPPRNKYTITVSKDGVDEYSNKIDLGFGEYRTHELNALEDVPLFSNTTGTVIAQGSITSYTFTQDYNLVCVTVTVGTEGSPSASAPTTTVEQYFYNPGTRALVATVYHSGTHYYYANSATYLLKDVKAGDTFSFSISGSAYHTTIVEC